MRKNQNKIDKKVSRTFSQSDIENVTQRLYSDKKIIQREEIFESPKKEFTESDKYTQEKLEKEFQ